MGISELSYANEGGAFGYRDDPLYEESPSGIDPSLYAEEQIQDTLAKIKSGELLRIFSDEEISALDRRKGNCHGLPANIFFPSDDKGVKAAQKICSTCPIRVPCLEKALRDREKYGVWGETSERERRRILKKRVAALATNTGLFT